MIYLNGSLRDPTVPLVADILRHQGYEVFDDWHASGPRADEHWRDYEMARGRSYRQALESLFSQNIFQFDLHHMLRCNQGLVVAKPYKMPGRSGLMELTYMRHAMKCPTWVLLQGNPEEWDQMLPLACSLDHILGSIDELREAFLRAPL